MGAGASVVIPKEGIDKEAAKAFLGDGFDEAKFDEIAIDGRVTRQQAIAFPNSPLTNSALVFIKPHANTTATKDFVATKLKGSGCTILTEGSISGTEIDSLKLIDQHYYGAFNAL